MSKESKSSTNVDNPYIPKYILDKPRWYDQNDENDALSHHRNNSEIKDYSLPTLGAGINDEAEVRTETSNYDEKRDRYYGYSNEQWLEHLKTWKPVPSTTKDNDDSDDTDYELELIELNLDRSKLKKNYKQDPMERMIRDRNDIPDYIKNITIGGEKKKQKDKEELMSKFINSDDQFVRKKPKDESDNLKDLQKFVWDLNKKSIKHEHLPESDLNLNVEASPTLMMMKQKEQHELKKKKKLQEIEERNLLLEKYR